MSTYKFTPEKLAPENGRAHGILAFGRVFENGDSVLQKDHEGNLRLVQQKGGSMNLVVSGDISELEVGVTLVLKHQ